MSEAPAAEKKVVIKKYANRRLYNTASSSYVTLDHLSDLVKQGVDFVVYDAKTNEDITRSVLAQIIFEQESRGETLLPAEFLRQLIGFYGESVHTLLPSYLQMSLAAFGQQQERMRAQMAEVAAGKPAGNFFEEQMRQNMAIFDKAVKMFTPPFAQKGAAAADPRPQPASGETQESIDALRKQMEAMQAQLDKLAGKGG